jgi:large subunit ribosomal protein L4e
MFAPTKTWRRWHRKINVNQKRYAVASALAASALPSLVMARGHKINNVPEIPLVTDNSIESVNKTKQAISALKLLGAYDDVEKSINSKKLRAGVGKMRNRRYTFRRGPLIVYSNDNGITRAFRNLPGVELCHVDALNLLQLAPGGHMGRFIIWTSGAFKRLVDNWGSLRGSSATRVGYRLPRPLMTNSDLTRIINSDEIQSKLRPVIPSKRLFTLHRNPLVNRATEEKLNPYSSALRRQVHASEQARKQARQALLDAKRNKTDSKKPASKPRHTLKQRSKNYSNLVDDHKFELSRANSLSTGGFNVASRNQKEAEQEA